jgi:hypothetical protein
MFELQYITQVISNACQQCPVTSALEKMSRAISLDEIHLWPVDEKKADGFRDRRPLCG